MFAREENRHSITRKFKKISAVRNLEYYSWALPVGKVFLLNWKNAADVRHDDSNIKIRLNSRVQFKRLTTQCDFGKINLIKIYNKLHNQQVNNKLIMWINLIFTFNTLTGIKIIFCLI